MTRRRTLAPAEERAWETFRRMSAHLDAELAHRLQGDGMSEADRAVLCALEAAPGGVLRSRELRCALFWEKSRLAHQVRRMEARGLVTRGACESDARASEVRLTETGRGAIATASPDYLRNLRALFFDALDADQLAALTAIGEQVLAHLQQVGTADSVAGFE
ncbi:MarR family winged helix-turn-helix transcriptional regulator [Jatrophihabitans sp. YIM 134969]